MIVTVANLMTLFVLGSVTKVNKTRSLIARCLK